MPRTLKILQATDDLVMALRLRITIPTAKNQEYPRQVQESSEVSISLPGNYPMQPGPMVTFVSPIWNPNVYASGRWCSGLWQVTENLELFVKRLMRVIALDPAIVNPSSPANVAAAAWYRQMLQRNPRAFPTVSLESLEGPAVPKPSIAWRSIR